MATEGAVTAASRDGTATHEIPETTGDRREARTFPGRARFVVATVALLLLLWLWVFSQIGELCLPLIVLLGCLVVTGRVHLGMASAS
jgi:fatty acid desaturase